MWFLDLYGPQPLSEDRPIIQKKTSLTSLPIIHIFIQRMDVRSVSDVHGLISNVSSK